MKIAIKKESNGLIYIDKNLRADIPYIEPPFNFKIIDVIAEDCQAEDFNDDLTFSHEKYNARKQKVINNIRIEEIKQEMESLSQDFIQYYLGATIENIEEKKAKFISLHNELRELLGKQPRIYK